MNASSLTFAILFSRLLSFGLRSTNDCRFLRLALPQRDRSEDIVELAFDRFMKFLRSAHDVSSLYGKVALSETRPTTSEKTSLIFSARRLNRKMNSSTYLCKCFRLIW